MVYGGPGDSFYKSHYRLIQIDLEEIDRQSEVKYEEVGQIKIIASLQHTTNRP